MKKALVGLAILLALGALGVYLAFSYLDLIVKVALERYGPEVTGTSVKVGTVHISARDGIGSIRDLEIGSSAGFGARKAARFGEIRRAIDASTIASPVVRV